MQKFARQLGGPGGWDGLMRDAALSGKVFSPAKAYDDADALALVGAASRQFGHPPEKVLELFGEFLGPELLRMYGRLIQPGWKTLDILENTENLIHSAVRVGNPGATPPVLECQRSGPGRLQILYASERRMCHLAKGIIRGIGRHFGETMECTEEACMHQGDPYCVIDVSVHTQGIDTDAAETIIIPGNTPAPRANQDRNPHTPTSAQGLFGSSPGAVSPDWSAARPIQVPGRFHHYRVDRTLGEGGMGIVYLAEDERLARTVALKVMQPHIALQTGMRQRFLREARALAAVRNDHVVTVYDVGESQGVPYMALEFLEGCGLDHLVKQDGPPALAGILRMGREAALGLAAVHAKGLVHRDIKPANLWVESPSGRLKILDLGLARVNGDTGWQSWAGGVVGTPGFMSPEQATGKEIDQKSDLFSLGCVLYWLTTGRYPFQGPDLLSTLSALATVEPAPPTTECPGVPARVSDLVMRLLDKNPENRPVSARVLAEDIGALERELFPSIRSG